MTPHFDSSRTGARWLCIVIALMVPVLGISGVVGAATPPTLNVSPSSNLHDGESVSISVGANNYFTPNVQVNILECADPGGSAANLPKDDSTCDGNTVQGKTVLVSVNGSFSEPDYIIYLLPSSVLGEQSNDQPVCNKTNPCVLYVGQNQNDFSAPKVFSAPFSIAPATGSASTTTSTSTRTSTSTSTTAVTSTTASTAAASTTPSSTATTAPTTTSPNASTSLTSTAAADDPALASTGAPAQALWVGASGAALIFFGSLGRRLVLRLRR